MGFASAQRGFGVWKEYSGLVVFITIPFSFMSKAFTEDVPTSIPI
jgi:hypothetical protein